jgi:ubiquinone/menaquinone biosynthesis C-methylase UbiE
MTEQNNTPPVCDYTGSDYQTSFWSEGGREYEDRCEVIALKRLLPETGKLMLEVGAGAGRNTPRYTGFERIVVMDYSVTQLQQAQERLGKSDKYIYVAANAYKLPFVDGLFDGATIIRVLHHMADGKNVLAQVRRVMQQGGTFILEYANKMNLKAIGRYLLKRQPWSPFAPEPVEFVELNFNFHPKTTRQWLKEVGFNVERQLTVSHFRVGFLKRLIPTGVLVFFDSLLQFTGGLLQIAPSVFTKNQAVGEPRAVEGDKFFQCPECAGTAFTEKETALHCEGCSKDWEIQNGIYIFK